MLLIAAPHAQDFCCCRVLDTPVWRACMRALWLAIRVNERCVACRRCKRRRASGFAPCRQAVTAIRLQSLTPSRLRHCALRLLQFSTTRQRAKACRALQYRPEFLAHLCQQFINFAGAVTGISQCEQRERMHFHDLAQIGQLLDGWAFQVALQRAHVGATGHVGERFLAQTTRLPYRPNRRCQ